MGAMSPSAAAAPVSQKESASAAKAREDTPPVPTITCGIAVAAATKLDADIMKLWDASLGRMASSEFVTSVVLIAFMASE